MSELGRDKACAIPALLAVLIYFDTLMIFQQGSLRQSYLIGTLLYKQAKSDSVILLGPIQNRVVVYSSIAG